MLQGRITNTAMRRHTDGLLKKVLELVQFLASSSWCKALKPPWGFYDSTVSIEEFAKPKSVLPLYKINFHFIKSISFKNQNEKRQLNVLLASLFLAINMHQK